MKGAVRKPSTALIPVHHISSSQVSAVRAVRRSSAGGAPQDRGGVSRSRGLWSVGVGWRPTPAPRPPVPVCTRAPSALRSTNDQSADNAFRLTSENSAAVAQTRPSAKYLCRLIGTSDVYVYGLKVCLASRRATVRGSCYHPDTGRMFATNIV